MTIAFVVSFAHTRVRSFLVLVVLATASAAPVAHPATVQQRSIGRASSGAIGVGLAVDAQGRVHMSWGSLDGKLHYTRIDGRRKTDVVVDAQPSCGDWSSIALDSAGLPQIAYHCVRDGQSLQAYASFDGSVWHSEVLGPGDAPMAIAIDADGQPHIAHEIDVLQPLASSYFELLDRGGSGWHAEQPGGFNAAANQPISLALDSDGHAHVGVNDPDRFQATYATNASGDWVVTSLGDNDPNTGQSVSMGSLVLDSAGRPHAALITSNPTTIRYSHFDGAQWLSEDLYDANALPPGTKDQPQSAAIALDSQDRPTILFMDRLSTLQSDPLGDLLVYAYRTGGQWSGVSLLARRGYAQWTRLAAAPDGAGIAMYGQIGGNATEVLRETRIAVPDLTAAWTSLAVTPGKNGMSRIDGVLQVSNLGAAKSGKPVVAFYLSSDDVLDPGDTLIASRRPVGAVAPGASRSARVSLQVAIPVNGLHLIAVIDPDERLEDRDRSNDVVAGLLGSP